MNSRLVRNAIALSIIAGVAALVIGFALGEPRSGVAVFIGLVIGSSNGLLIQRSLALGMAFTALSLARLLFLTGIGLGTGLLIGLSQVWLVVAGIAVAQIVLAGWAVREALA
ncbi:MAG TPA: hypothetical protein VIT43_02315 [Candidatus Dormibacteraeota bacterium]